MADPLLPFYVDEIRTTFESALGGVESGYDSEADDLSQVPSKPFLCEIRGVKSTAAYLAHSYPTKIPPEAIVPYIEHYTKPGDVVLDPFCGSGMTGIAARITGRNALLNDLSVGAAHLSYNHCTPCDPETLVQAFSNLAAQCEGEFRWLYGSRCDKCNGPARVVYTLWSAVVTCLTCRKPNVFWDVGIHKERGQTKDNIRCCWCHKKARRRSFTRFGSPIPVVINYECLNGCGIRGEHKPSKAELRLIKEINSTGTPYAYPDITIDTSSEMYIRCALHLHGIQKLADFYTSRNLRALGKIWDEILRINDRRIRANLAFAFTNTAWHASRMRRFNARGGQRPLTGTLYIPQLSVEANPLPIFEHKIRTLSKFYKELNAYGGTQHSRVDVRIGCATNLHEVRNSSVDYIFTDPPFGSNIFYADLNLIWESWLGQLTNATTEAVINRSKKDGKTLRDYYGLMKKAFCEMHRVLKPGRWASVVFHNSNDEVWRVVRAAVEEAGFMMAYAGGIDKSKRSMRGYIGKRNDENVADGDVVLNLRKPFNGVCGRSSRPLPVNLEQIIREVISRHLIEVCTSSIDRQARRKFDPRSIQYIHSLAVRALLNQNYALGKVSFAFIRELCQRYFRLQDGRVFLRRHIRVKPDFPLTSPNKQYPKSLASPG